MRAEDAYPSPFSHDDAPHRTDGEVEKRAKNNGDKKADVGEEREEETSWLLNSIEGPFQVQEYIALLVRADPHNVERIVRLPARPPSSSSSPATSTTKGKAAASTPAEGGGGAGAGAGEKVEDKGLVNGDVWVYEQLRRLSQDLSHPWVTSLQEECTRDMCPEMKAGEWLYLCAAHATANEVRPLLPASQ